MSDEEDQGAAPDNAAQGARSAAETAATEATGTEVDAGKAGKPEPQNLDQDNIESLLQQAESGIAEAAGESPASRTGTAAPSAFELGELEAGDSEGPGQSLDLLGDVELDLRIELGRTMMRLEDVLQLRGGSVVVLDKLAGDPVDIFVNGRMVARGEVLVMNDNFCIRVTELAGSLA